MTQNLLDDFVGNAEPMKIRRQSAPKRVPAVPRNLLRFERGPNHFTRQQIKIQRVAPEISKNKSLRKITRRSAVPIEKKFQLRDHRNRSLAFLPLWLPYLVPPHGVLHLDGVTVIVLPKKSTAVTAVKKFMRDFMRKRRELLSRRLTGKKCDASAVRGPASGCDFLGIFDDGTLRGGKLA